MQAADEKLAKGLEEALGPDRYLDYQLATSGTGQQLRNFASRYDLPRETLSKAFHLQKEIQRLESAQQASARYGGAISTRQAQGERTLEQLQQEMERTLGPELYKAWNEGRNLKYDLQPGGKGNP